jgi:4-oxalomesaconate tautomerase
MTMTQRAIPFLFMRGGTSRGPYFNRADLPADLNMLSKVLVSLIGSGHPLNIDGIGGGAAVTTKVAMLSKSTSEWADIDYFFAQVGVENKLVDYKPTCGNILSGVGPAALEMGLLEPSGNETLVKIRAVNTNARIVAKVQTPGGQVAYDGETAIAGVPGTASAVELRFMDVVGSVTGSLLPTGSPVDVIDGVSVTCMDVAMPMVIARAVDFGLTGYENSAELDENRTFFERMEAIRIEAGRRMGMGAVQDSVTPKFGLIAPPISGGTICARYFMPWECHPSMAVTGSQCLASCLLAPGTVAQGLSQVPSGSPAHILIEHPLGKIGVVVDYSNNADGFNLRSAGLIRTARKLAAGEVYIPAGLWA